MTAVKKSYTVRGTHILNSINVNGEKINQVSDSKYLGIIIDVKFSWKKHIEELNEKL